MLELLIEEVRQSANIVKDGSYAKTYLATTKDGVVPERFRGVLDADEERTLIEVIPCEQNPGDEYEQVLLWSPDDFPVNTAMNWYAKLDRK